MNNWTFARPWRTCRLIIWNLFRKPDWGEGKIIRLDKDLKLWCCDTQCCCGNLLWLSEGKTVCWSFLEWVDKFDKGLYNRNHHVKIVPILKSAKIILFMKLDFIFRQISHSEATLRKVARQHFSTFLMSYFVAEGNFACHS